MLKINEEEGVGGHTGLPEQQNICHCVFWGERTTRVTIFQIARCNVRVTQYGYVMVFLQYDQNMSLV